MANYYRVGDWFVSVFDLAKMSVKELSEISNNPNYRKSTRRNARNYINLRQLNKDC